MRLGASGRPEPDRAPANRPVMMRFAGPVDHCNRSRLMPPAASAMRCILALLGFAAGGVLPVRAGGSVIEAVPAQVESFLDGYCVRCHGTDKSKGGLVLHTLSRDVASGADARQWTRALEMLVAGEMPPEDEKQPPEDERRAVVQWLRTALEAAEQRAPRIPATARRLTNHEYHNTMRDLLGIELKFSEGLPRDPVKPYRFNNTAELMRMGPEQLDLYLEAARRAMASVIVDPEKPVARTTRREWKAEAQGDRLPMREVAIWPSGRGSAGQGMSVQNFPRTGEFRVRFQAAAVLTPGVREVPLRIVMGQNYPEVNSATMLVEPVGTVRLSNPPDSPRVFELRGRIENHAPQKNRTKQGAPLPDTLTLVPQNLHDDGTLNDDNGFKKTRLFTTPRAAVDWMEFEAPVTDVWPPAHHARILFDSPLRTSDPRGYVRAVLERFMARAYRRPAAEEEVNRFVAIYDTLLPELKTLEATVRETISLVLVSPPFLFHTAEEGASPVQRQHELASRLSYFLWASMPDEELLTLAGQGRLDDADVIGGQVLRLLADARARDFIRIFTTQWLNIEKMRTVPINRDRFPRFLYYVPLGEREGTEEPYRPTIRDYMMEETPAFIAELIRSNASLFDIVHSDFACLNEPLAAHYGVSGVQGDELRRVPLKPEHRLGGLLTQGSVLIGTGTGTAPHPVYRAVWLREAILGDEVAPPPAEVPALADSAGESAEKAPTIAELLARHRRQESCRDCHARLDPWGIPFEQYNATGKFQPLVPQEGVRVKPFKSAEHRDLAGYAAYLASISTVPVLATARLPHGPEIRNLDDLKAYLIRERRDDIAENVTRRLLACALGRQLTWHDRRQVEEIVRLSQAGGHRLRDLIVLICRSSLFRTPETK